MKKTVLLVLAVVLLLSLTAVSQAQESPVITVYKDKTTKIIMAVQYTEYKDNSGDVQLIIALMTIGICTLTVYVLETLLLTASMSRKLASMNFAFLLDGSTLQENTP